ncbi:MAG: mucoidy inhibitor MuiA family protein [Planctomycetes bacterium]|nr:mucoidy inhibitor MuiA family protein [Planctomycetota bacterium]
MIHSMKISFISIVVLCFSGVVGGQAVLSKPENVPFAVTVFEDKARVHRQKEVEGTKGTREVVFSGLPASLDPASLRGRLVKSEDIKGLVLGVRMTREGLNTPPVDEVITLQEQLDNIKDQLLEVSFSLNRIELQSELLKRYRAILETSVSLTARELGKSFDSSLVHEIQQWLLDSDLSVAIEVDRLKQDQEKLNDRRGEILFDLNSYSIQEFDRGWTATVIFQLETSGTVSVELAYDVPTARWTPFHDARLDESTGFVSWEYGAKVIQSSGEDWKDVQLTLSTLRSSLGLSSGQLIPQEVTAIEIESKNKAARSLDSVNESPTEDSIRMDTEDFDDSWGAAPLVESDSGGVVTYQLKTPSSIPADGSAHAVTVAKYKMKATLDYQSIPLVSPRVFRRAKLVHEGIGVLLAGEVQCYRSGTFVGTGSVGTIYAGQSFEQHFGVEGRINVHVQDLQSFDKESSSSVFSRARVERRTGYTVKSYLEGEVPLELVSRIPVSMLEEVKVELGSDTEPTPQVNEDGICRWILNLKKGKPQEVILHWTAVADKGSEALLDLLK